MSTDITIEAAPVVAYGFVEFAHEHAPMLGQSLRLIADNDPAADAALDVGLRSTFEAWARLADPDRGLQRAFGAAVEHCRSALGEMDTPTQHGSRVPHLDEAACSIAHHVYGWDVEICAIVVGLELDDANRHLAASSQEIAERVAETEPARVDLDAIISRRAPSRFRTSARIALTAAAALLVVAGLAQFIARPDRPAPPLQESAQTEPARAAPVPPAVDEEIAKEAALDPEIQPSLITTDGDGGFVGVVPPASPDQTVRFLRSAGGAVWEIAGTWDFDPSATITRFERVGESFVVWLTSPGANAAWIADLGVSADLAMWDVLDQPAPDVQPFGLIYQHSIADVSISGDNVLAMIRTNVEINFGALSLSEGYTCGHSITDKAVSVNLCNDAHLDVLSFSGLEQLPAPNRLFISRAGAPFEPSAEPFARETDVRLATANGAFALADETGIRFATSTDARTWQANAAQEPPLEVQTSATNDAGQVLGVGPGATGQLRLFFNDGPNTTSTLLNEIVIDASADVTVLLTSGPTRWVAYLFDTQDRAWIMTSPSGLNWQVDPAPPPAGNDPRLVASDDIALVQSTDGAGSVITMAVSLR